MKIRNLFNSFLIINFIIINFVRAQYSEKILDIATEPLIEGESINVTVELATSLGFSKIEFAYRNFIESEFRTLEMNITGSLASTVIPAKDVTPPYIEYFIKLYLTDQDKIETYPIENPTLAPIKLFIKEKPIISLIWFSPAQNEKQTADDCLIAFAIENTDTTLDIGKTKIFLDDKDITEKLILSENTFVGKIDTSLLYQGLHYLKIELYNYQMEVIHSEKKQFSIIKYLPGEVKLKNINYKGSFSFEKRNENISGFSSTYNRGTIYANSEYDFIKLNSMLYLTNEEKSYRQPQNRYFIGLEIPHLKIGYGDVYPIFPSLIMSGKRTRGFLVEGYIGFFHLNILYGELTRKIPSEVQKVDSPDDPTKTYILDSDSTTWLAIHRRGEFKRDIFVIRPIFKKGENFNLGFSYLKSKDDKNSIQYGIMPKENLVLGTDLYLSFDKRRIELTSQAAFSAMNNDITTGTIQDEQIDTFFNSLTESEKELIRKVKNTLSKFITVNEHIVPLSLRNLTTLAYEGALSLNYFDNQLKISYIKRGSAYESFGQSYIRKDIHGFNLIDRIRLLKNRLFISLGLERLTDNTDHSKLTTTQYTTFNSSILYYPIQNLPSISLGYTHGTTKNHSPDANFEINDLSNRIFFQTNYNFKYLASHTILLNLSTSSRNDQTYRNLDLYSASVTIGINTIYTIPLQTSINISHTSNKINNPSSGDGQNLNYTTTSLSAYYNLSQNKLKLSLGIRPTFGDINRAAYDFGFDYQLYKKLFLNATLNFYTYKSRTPDSVLNFILRYEI